MCYFQWFCVAVVLCSAMFSCDARIICIIPMDGFYLLLSYFSFIKNLYSTMCVCIVYKFIRIESWGVRAKWMLKKVKSMFTSSEIARPMFALRDFRYFFCSFTTPFHILFVLYFIYTLHYRQVNVNSSIGSGKWRHCPKWVRQKKCYKHI